MASQKQIESFLRDFKFHLDFWGLLIRSDRQKNFATMLELEYSINDVKNELKRLEFQDYSEGPLKETLYKSADMWVFGKMIQSKEVYIKITMGLGDSKVLCISFHFAERAMCYPFKKSKQL